MVKLDIRPNNWEDRLTLFVGHLIDSKKKAATVKSYISGIKCVLRENGIEINKNRFLLASLTRACIKVNDHIRARFPIKCGFLNMLLRKVRDFYALQPYLEKLFSAIFDAGYFGLLRIGEVTLSPHAILAKDVHIGENKNKILFILRSSKTHCKATSLNL